MHHMSLGVLSIYMAGVGGCGKKTQPNYTHPLTPSS